MSAFRAQVKTRLLPLYKIDRFPTPNVIHMHLELGSGLGFEY